MDKDKRIKYYIVLAYLGAYSLSFCLWLAGGLKSNLLVLFGLLSMLVPTIAAVLIRWYYQEGYRDIAWKRFPIGYLLLALIGPIAMVFVGMGAYLWLFENGISWAKWLTPDAQGLFYPPPDARFKGPLTLGELQEKIVISLTLNMIIMCLFTFGEEFGWRGYLQPRLEKRFGTRVLYFLRCR